MDSLTSSTQDALKLLRIRSESTDPASEPSSSGTPGPIGGSGGGGGGAASGGGGLLPLQAALRGALACCCLCCLAGGASPVVRC